MAISYTFNPFTSNLDSLDGSGAGASNSFETIVPTAGTNVVADSSTDTLTLTSTDTSVTITGTAGTDTLDFSVSAANKTLSNLNSPTAINRDLIGATGATWNVKTQDSGLTNTKTLILSSGAGTAGVNSGDVFLQSGNVSGGGNRGVVNIQNGKVEIDFDGGAFFSNQDGESALFLYPNSTETSPSGNPSDVVMQLYGSVMNNTELVTIMTTNSPNATATGTTSMEISTGKVDNAASTGNSGSIQLSSGPSIATDGAASTGLVVIQSGHHTAGTGNSGGLYVATGNTSGGTSGELIINSGNCTGVDGGSGVVSLSSGELLDSDSNSGEVFINSGPVDAGNGSSGSVNILTGDTATANSGSVFISTGGVGGGSGNAGDIRLSPGTSTGGSDGSVICTGTTKFNVAVGPTVAGPVVIVADNQIVVTTGVSYLQLDSDSVVAVNRTFLLTAGAFAGHQLVLEWVAATNLGELSTSISGGGNVRLAGGAVWLPTRYDSLSLIFNGVDWIETSRSVNA